MSAFLLGPRQTGKSTLSADTLPNTLFIDLLSRKTFQQLASDPEVLFDWAMNSPATIIVIGILTKKSEQKDFPATLKISHVF
jgi:hypothetical protein